ncbi:replication initiation protein [Cytobacillus sp. FJAT-54145]|uniref:Replication initiation protein n=1 Tax=Cytobacillus spartinae TaxID=3299023 RepID=A0ABW6KAD4_9BACI
MPETYSDEQLSLDLEAEIKPNYWVNQSTELINMRQDLTLTERRIIFALVALVQPDDHDFKTYVIRVKDLADLIGIQANSFYDRVEKAIDGLQKKVLEIHSENGKVRDKISWVQRSTYNDGEGTVRIQLGEALAQFLLNLRSYTKYRLINVLKLKSEYSWRIYELLKEKEWISNPVTKDGKTYKTSRVIRVEDLRHLLNIPDDKYKLMKHFRESVLDQAQKELKKETDIVFEYEVYKKKGRKIDSFIFYINENPKFKKPQIDIDTTTTDLQDILHKLVRYGVRQKKAIDLIETFDYHYLDANIRYVLQDVATDDVQNLAGYLIKAIEENYANHTVVRSTEQDDPMYKILLGKLDTQLDELTKRDVADLKDIIRIHQNQLTLYATTEEEVRAVGIRREKALRTKWESIQSYREKHQHPPLHPHEIDDDQVKRIMNGLLVIEA